MPVPHVTKDNKVMWREIVWLARQDIYLLQESALQVQIAPLLLSKFSFRSFFLWGMEAQGKEELYPHNLHFSC